MGRGSPEHQAYTENMWVRDGMKDVKKEKLNTCKIKQEEIIKM
jgi:L-rhamnose isomerase